MKKTLLTAIGIISLVLGVLGVIIPLLPTTPFLLLSSFLFLKGSSKLHLWLINQKYLGKYIKDFEQEKSIPLKVKITSVSFLWLTISYSALFIVKLLWLKILLLAIAIAVTLHILHYKTRK